MADDDVELVGGIAVSVGASHNKLVSDLAEADRLIEAWARRKVNITVGAQFTGAQGQAAGSTRQQPSGPAMSFGPGSATRAQAQQGQTSLQRAVNEALAKTGERLDANGEIVSNTTRAIRGQRQAIIEVDQAAANVTPIDLGLGPVREDLMVIVGLLREAVTESRTLSSVPPPKTTGRATTARAARSTRTKDEDEEAEEAEEEGFPRIQYVDQIERQRRETREARGRSAIETDRSEAALWRQRQREEARTAREQAAASQAAARAARRNQQPDTSRLDALTAEAAADAAGLNRPESGTFAPQRRQQDVAAFQAEMAARAAARRTIVRRSAEEEAAFTARINEQAARANRPGLGGDGGTTGRGRGGVGGGGGAGITEDDRERRTAARTAIQEAQAVSAARTARTQASGLGGFIGGVTRERIEATADLAEKEQRLTAALRTQRDVIARYPRDLRAQKAAQEEVTVATTEFEGALRRVEKLSGFAAGARNLVAITTAGAAFGIGLKAVDVVVSALGQSLGNLAEIQLGFGATSTRVTGALAVEARALRGNADAAIAARAAQAGLSAESTEAITVQLRLATQIKAGAQAQQEASELFRAAAGRDNAPSGLFGGYGGVAGTALLAQQLGGGRGFTETIQQDLAAFTQGRRGPDLLGDFNRGLAYATNPGVRGTTNQLALQQGNAIVPAIGALIDLPNIIGDIVGGNMEGALERITGPANAGVGAALPQEAVAYVNNLNDAARRAAPALGETATATLRQATSQEEVQRGMAAAAAAGDAYGVTLAQQQGLVVALGDAVAKSGEEYQRAIQQFAVGAGIADPATLAKANLAAERQRQRESAASLDVIRARQEFELPSIIAGIQRQTQFATQVQQPTQFLLQGLAAPATPVGTGIAPSDQGSVAGDLEAARELQGQLNAEYERGQEIVENTYRPAIVQNFGAAAAAAFDTALRNVTVTGQEIAGIQARISNDQAAYQVAQYNFQLHIARRTLGDIAGLTGANFGVEESKLGVLQRQNLELSRQGQQLQFELSQRQINFQTAVAGFQAPGVTPEERQANIAAAKIEADFAQRQLNIQREMFGNQVQIVDIGNLRQGRDLVNQIGLLMQGRQLTIDTAAAEQRLQRLNRLQQRNVAQVGTYLSAVDNVVSVAFGHIGQLEAAAGRAMTGVATQVLSEFGIFINGLAEAMGGGFSGATTGGFGNRTGSGPQEFATGGVIGVTGPTRIGNNAITGEAGDETLIILSRPRSASGSSGSATVVVNFNGDIHTSNAGDLDRITQAVLRAMGRGMSTAGLRTGN